MFARFNSVIDSNKSELGFARLWLLFIKFRTYTVRLHRVWYWSVILKWFKLSLYKFQVNLSRLTVVTGILTQGNCKQDWWVTEFTLEYSTDGITFTNVLKRNTQVKVSIHINNVSKWIGTVKYTLSTMFLSLLHVSSKLVLHNNLQSYWRAIQLVKNSPY